MSINELEWVTCLYCGTNFQVSVSKEATRVFSYSSYEDDAQDDSFFTHCPKCKKKNFINVFH